MDKLILRITVTVAALAFVFLHLFVNFDTIALGLIVLAMVPWLPAFLQSAEIPGGWKFQFDRVKEQQVKQGEDIARLKFLLEGFVTEDELKHLTRLHSQAPFTVKVDDTTKYFESELRRLRALGLVANPPEKGVRSLLVADGKTRNVHEHFHITEKGREYLKLRGVTTNA